MPRNPEVPEPGFYRLRLVRRGPYVPARIVLEEGLWQVILNGAPSGKHEHPWAIAWMHKVWPYAETIMESDYDYMLAYAQWAEKHAPEDPAARPNEPIDVTTLPPPF